MLLFLSESMSVITTFPARSLPGRIPSCATGLTLVEVMVSMAILVLTTVGGVSGFMIFNNYAASSRNISSAKALCQERIEEVQTLIFTPPSSVPTVIGQMDTTTNNTNYFLLGPGSNSVAGMVNGVPGAKVPSVYNTTTGVYTGSNPLTPNVPEPVRVYVQQDGVTNTVIGTRTTTVSLASLVDGSGSGLGSLGVMSFTVTVNYTYRGKPYSYSMYTLRSPD